MAVLQNSEWYHKHNGKQNVRYCEAKCTFCGKVWEIKLCEVNRRPSCGCKNQRSFKHGLTKTRAYRAWVALRRRCNNPSDANFSRYGGRGIKVCATWNRSFRSFLQDMGHPPSGMSIDRINNDGDYEPSNCRWATPRQQQRNRRCNRTVIVNGEEMTLAEAAEKNGHVNASAIAKRIDKHGMTESHAAQLPPMRQTHSVEIYGKTLPLKDWCFISGTKYPTAWARLNKGWNPKHAVFGRG